jgi:hypothetical protein
MDVVWVPLTPPRRRKSVRRYEEFGGTMVDESVAEKLRARWSGARIRWVVAIAALVSLAGCSNKSPTGAAGTGATSATGTNGNSTGKGATSTTGGGTPCNPVTGAPCMIGEGCGLSTQNMYVCFPPPNDTPLCGACDPNMDTCANKTACVNSTMTGNGECFQYCCTDADCGGKTGSCDKLTLGDGITGFCGKPDAGGGSFGTPVCTGIPPAPPSMGSCASPVGG